MSKKEQILEFKFSLRKNSREKNMEGSFAQEDAVKIIPMLIKNSLKEMISPRPVLTQDGGRIK